jgi:hypothetical protein
MKGTEVAGIEMTDDNAKALVIDTAAMKVLKNEKYIRPRFNTALGIYIDSGFTGPESGEIDKIFEEVKVVDESDFALGMCPDEFKDVPGYRKVFNEMDAAQAEEEIVWDLRA